AERSFERVLAMPNLVPPLTTVESILDYRSRILGARQSTHFTPYFALYFTSDLNTSTLKAAKDCPWILGVKWYPQGATTHSDWGVQDIQQHFKHLALMEELGLPLLIHGEVTDDHIDIFDRETRFIESILEPLQRRFPQLPIVLEHITTKEAVAWVESMPAHIAATITVHHLAFNRNHLLAGGLRPDYYCLPILKQQQHQQALQQAAMTPGQTHFFLGTDSAPHVQDKKYSACGCAGCFTSPIALALLAELFYQHNALSLLETFTSINGAHFYHLPVNTRQLGLVQKDWVVPANYTVEGLTFIPLLAGQTLSWQSQGIQDNTHE
ncbi:MAG: dihydroorotase, partial [Gammaproteobacteria bacterium]|nr:dihydroorotase [Gammaproteobacteria bacterium]